MRATDTTTTIPTPSAFFGVTPGEDRVLIRWADMLRYFRELDAASPRLHLEVIGQSTEGRDMIAFFVAHPEVIAELDQHAEHRQALLDNALLADPELADGMAAGDKTIVLVTSAIHATEVGSIQLCPELLHDLATRDDAEIDAMLANTITIIVPTLNPDGMDIVQDWYEQTLGTHAEGANPPALYHRYAGHDNNRDWVHLQLAESRTLVERIHRRWKPHMLIDLHQMQQTGPRFFLPPFIDPIEQHVHPDLVAGGNAIGAHIATRMIAAGLSGTATGVLFDAFSPTRAYTHYHGGVRILAEAASAKIATPITLTRDELVPARGFDPRIPGVHNPLPWTEGTWRLRDIMDYHREAVLGTIEHGARNRPDWLRRQWQILASTAHRTDARTFVIPPLPQQEDPAATRTLLQMMHDAEIRIDRLNRPAPDANGTTIPGGSFLVSTAQPFGTWPEAMLLPTVYPSPTPDARPYDTTTHSASVHMGVEITEAIPTDEWLTQPFEPSMVATFPLIEARRVGQGRWIAVDARGHAAIQLVAEILASGGRARRLAQAHFAEGRVFDPGTWILSDTNVATTIARADALALRTFTLPPFDEGLVEITQPRIGLHLADRGNATDAGWTRMVFERLSIPFTLLSDQDLLTRDLAEYDVILLPHLAASSLVDGNPAKDYPEAFAGKPGAAGFARLRAFVEDGGSLVAVGGAAQAVIGQFPLPIALPLQTLAEAEYFAPGAMVKGIVDPHHPLAWGLPHELPLLFSGRNAFQASDDVSGYTSIVTAAPDGTVVSGWMHGAEHLQGHDLVAQVTLGNGRITVIAGQPMFRAQTHVTFNLLVNALYAPGRLG